MTVRLRNGTTVEDHRLDRLPSARTDHLERYPLTAATMPAQKTAMVQGINWYANFDRPVQRRINGYTYWTIGAGNLGSIRGGHATALPAWGVPPDLASWWVYYDQGTEGRCVEFAVLRMLSLANRFRYDITSRWHYWEAQRTDEWQGGSYPGAVPQYEGTSVRAGLDVVLKRGAIRARPQGAPVDPAEAPGLVRPEEGIAAYRWATSWDDVRAVTGTPGWLPGVIMLNNWGKDGYPHRTVLLDEAGQRVLAEDGEYGVVVDR